MARKHNRLSDTEILKRKDRRASQIAYGEKVTK